MKKVYICPECVPLLLECESFLSASLEGNEGPDATDHYSDADMLSRRKKIWKNDLWEE